VSWRAIFFINPLLPGFVLMGLGMGLVMSPMSTAA
jgi:hypothetical protein